MKLVTEANGLGNPIIESSATKQGSNVELASQVSDRDITGNLGLNIGPELVPREFPGTAITAESEALLGSNLGPDAMKIAEGLSVTSLEKVKVARAISGDKGIICKSSGYNAKRSHVPGSW